jgi:hypothetical protein
VIGGAGAAGSQMEHVGPAAGAGWGSQKGTAKKEAGRVLMQLCVRQEEHSQGLGSQCSAAGVREHLEQCCSVAACPHHFSSLFSLGSTA